MLLTADPSLKPHDPNWFYQIISHSENGSLFRGSVLHCRLYNWDPLLESMVGSLFLFLFRGTGDWSACLTHATHIVSSFELLLALRFIFKFSKSDTLNW